MMLKMAGECGDDIVPSCQSQFMWLVWMKLNVMVEDAIRVQVVTSWLTYQSIEASATLSAYQDDYTKDVC
jgi:hypothetical protein